MLTRPDLVNRNSHRIVSVVSEKLKKVKTLFLLKIRYLGSVFITAETQSPYRQKARSRYQRKSPVSGIIYVIGASWLRGQYF